MAVLDSVKLKKEREMQTSATYVAVFYDIDKPKTWLYAMNKRIPERLFNNLCDGFEGKQVELRANDDFLANYTVVAHRTFQIFNSIDNCYYVICDCKKVKLGDLSPDNPPKKVIAHDNG